MRDLDIIEDSSLCFLQPDWRVHSCWKKHAPFGFFCVELLRPRVIVELGTYWGYSYCVFCQAVKELGLDAKCFAVDTWQGDKQSGWFGARGRMFLEQLRAHNRRYESFSTLIESTFDEACPQFENLSIDLLHIDGLHTYEAVKHDFETWLPKMSDRGVVLFHDTEERVDEFGVWRLWEELSHRYPHFSFLHEHGLGVLHVGRQWTALLEIAQRSQSEIDCLRRYFERLGELV